MLPEAKAPFNMLVLPQSGTVNFDHCGFAISFEESAGKSAGFPIPISQCFRYQSGPAENVNVGGAIENVAITPIQEGVKFYATLYDSTGTVIGQGYTYREMNMFPGEVESFNFQVATFFPVLSANFTVTVQSVDYAIEGEFNGVVILEFRSFLILPLFVAITLLAVLGVKRKGSLCNCGAAAI